MYLFFNSEFHPASTPLFTAGNRAYRYGEGLFETMLYNNGLICFLDDHVERLLNGIKTIGLKTPAYFDLQFIERTVDELVKKNGHEPAARIRLSITAGNGLLSSFDENGFNVLIESFSLETLPGKLNEQGLIVGLLPGATKNTDVFSCYKTASHLTYALAARYAVECNLDDCIVLNTGGAVCDTSIANIFMIKEKEIITPPLSSGCIDGVFRKNLLNRLYEKGYPAAQREIRPAELETADELFTTNVIQGIRWISRYNGKEYGNKLTAALAKDMLPALYAF